MAFTSSGPQGGRALVDFIMARSVQVTPLSRCVRFLHDHPHKSLNPSCHCPLLVSWSLGWAPWSRKHHDRPPSPLSRLDVAQFEKDAGIRSDRFLQCCRAVSEAVAQVSDLDQLASSVYRALIPFYAMHSARRDPVWREPSVTGSVHDAWRLWRELMRQAGSGMRALCVAGPFCPGSGRLAGINIR